MIVVKVELWPCGIEEKARELSRVYIANTGERGVNGARGDYKVAVTRKGTRLPPWPVGAGLNATTRALRTGRVANYPRKALHVLHLVAQAIRSCYPAP